MILQEEIKSKGGMCRDTVDKGGQTRCSFYSISLWLAFQMWKLISLKIWGDLRYFYTTGISSCSVARLPGQLGKMGFARHHWQVQVLWTKALGKEMSSLKDQNAVLPSTLCFCCHGGKLMVVIFYEKKLSWFSRVSLESPLQGQWGTVVVWGYLFHPPSMEPLSPTGALGCRAALHGSAAWHTSLPWLHWPLLDIFSLNFSKTLIFPVSWVEALLEVHPCHTGILFLPCYPAAEPTRRLLVQTWAPAAHTQTHTKIIEIISVPHLWEKTQQKEPHPFMSCSAEMQEDNWATDVTCTRGFLLQRGLLER